MNTIRAMDLLSRLIQIPSFSREEDKTASLLYDFLEEHGAEPRRKGNNVWSIHPNYDENKPTLLLNSHHDTVKPNQSYTRDPFFPAEEHGRLYGLGSNDAGGPLVCMIATFLNYYHKPLESFNLVVAATAEEEISGKNGIESILKDLPPVAMAIVGEPTGCKAAVAEKGLLVLDCVSHGVAGHAARNEGENAIYKALNDINWVRNYRFPAESEYLGPIRMTVTVIHAGELHNTVPDRCTFTIDVRTTDSYTLEETLQIIRENLSSEVNPRSVRLKPSCLPAGHPLYLTIDALGIEKYGSPTLSDQALLPCPSLKIGPGESARSHTADEYIKITEIEEGIRVYDQILYALLKQMKK